VPEAEEARRDEGASAPKSYFAGVDSGSTTTNVVILDDEGNVRGMSSVPTGGKVDQSAKKALGAALAQAKIMPMNVKYIVSTGYGRSALRWPDKDITEITCHARGAHQLYPEAATVIDIGGQDSKIIQLDGEGGVSDFMMNDKCAAGTGRFLEMMASTLDITMEEFIAAGLEWNEDIVISSMCAVFAESEVVSLIAREKAVSDIVHGLNNSVAKRVINMIARQGADGPYVMTGGVAKNNGVANALSEALHEDVLIPRNPEYCGAFGAAHFALEMGKM
jgi:predicted CoA-substrate-specific enzyme activase